ncbi:MAG: prepilin-type N-terminal cleavage/methylation domain-containing protein [Endomicrobium sp.]|jgi:prepilin-type N-terminal cleavage/methylation domain-containing protein|nr:prepilin-type N-terminal cleavage/methylation domain-containing protein [Endomicrobium sp.]
MKKKSGFSLIEVLITMVLVGILSTLCGSMLIFAYSMFEKVMGNGIASIEYKKFRLKSEKIYRNMTLDGPIIGEIISTDTGNPPTTPEEEKECIKFDVELFYFPHDGFIHKRKYNEVLTRNTTTQYYYYDYDKYKYITDQGKWNGHVGRAVSLYSCIENEKIDVNYKRYLMRMELDDETKKNIVVLYTWDAKSHATGGFVKINNEDEQKNNYDTNAAIRDVLLSDVIDFQVTTWISNLYPNRIKVAKYENISVVRLYVKLGEDSDAQYSNDMIFANKSIYGTSDNFFSSTDDWNVVKN